MEQSARLQVRDRTLLLLILLLNFLLISSSNLALPELLPISSWRITGFEFWSVSLGLDWKSSIIELFPETESYGGDEIS